MMGSRLLFDVDIKKAELAFHKVLKSQNHFKNQHIVKLLFYLSVVVVRKTDSTRF